MARRGVLEMSIVVRVAFLAVSVLILVYLVLKLRGGL